MPAHGVQHFIDKEIAKWKQVIEHQGLERL